MTAKQTKLIKVIACIACLTFSNALYQAIKYWLDMPYTFENAVEYSYFQAFAVILFAYAWD